MSKRKSLGKLIRLRSIREREARISLGDAQQEQLEALHAAEAAARAKEAWVLEALTPIELRAAQLMGLRLHELAEAADADHTLAQHRLAGARSAWSQASADLDGASHLEERRRREAAIMARSAAERALDDLEIVRHGRADEHR